LNYLERNVEQRERPHVQNNEEVFNFGKYKGRLVSEVFEREPQYYNWMMKADFPLYTKKILTAIKMRGFNS